MVLKILIFGAGVLGSVYAGRLAAAGQDVAMLARGARLKQLQRDGLVLLDEATGQKARPRVRVVAELRPEEVYDLVVVVVRAEQLADALPPLAANRRVPCILFLQNHALGPEALMAALGPDRVLLGFPGASGACEGATVRYRLVPQQKTTLGELSPHVTPRLREIAAALRAAGFPVALSRRMDAWLKTHAVFVTAVAGAIYDAGGSCAALVSQPGGVARLVRAVRQGFRALRACGVSIEPRKLAVLFLWLPLAIPVAYWRSYIAQPAAELIFARHVRTAPAEMLELVRQVRELIHITEASAPDLNRIWAAVERWASTRPTKSAI
jgi:2-dehydropantoate 2-reductase